MNYRVCKPGDAAWDPRLKPWVAWVSFGGQGWAAGFEPDFAPDFMLRAGVFGDAYFGSAAGQERWAMIQPLAPTWVPTRFGKPYERMRGSQCRTVNAFGRPASFGRDWWLDRGLIVDWDPMGWFEWYCWYWLGRRITGYDDWQIQRWRSFRERHGEMYRATPTGGHAQALLHWGIDAKKIAPLRT